MKTERLKKLETELQDLEQWMKLGLVPKKELKRHTEEIEHLKTKIHEEKERLQFLKENGENEEYSVPRRTPQKAAYPEMPSITDIEFGEESEETSYDVETESVEMEGDEEEGAAGEEAGGGEAADGEEEPEDEEDPFSDRNRWRRGGILDPDATEW